MKTALNLCAKWRCRTAFLLGLLGPVPLGCAAETLATDAEAAVKSESVSEENPGATSAPPPAPAAVAVSEPAPAWDEYTNSYESIPGRGSRMLFDLPIPHAGLYQVNWHAEVYSLDPQAALSGICSVVDDPAKAFYYDAAAYNQDTPQSGFTSNDGNTPPYQYRRVSGAFVAYVDGGAALVLRCVSSVSEDAGGAPAMDKILSASMFARKLD
jgi:hypothetical protein